MGGSHQCAQCAQVLAVGASGWPLALVLCHVLLGDSVHSHVLFLCRVVTCGALPPKPKQQAICAGAHDIKPSRAQTTSTHEAHSRPPYPLSFSTQWQQPACCSLHEHACAAFMCIDINNTPLAIQTICRPCAFPPHPSPSHVTSSVCRRQEFFSHLHAFRTSCQPLRS